MRVSVYGCDLTGLVTAGALASTGNDVLGLSVGSLKAEDLQQGILPREEPGLKELIQGQLEAGRLNFSSDWRDGIAHAEIIFFSMPSWRFAEAKKVVSLIAETAVQNLILVVQSTVPVGTAEHFSKVLNAGYRQRNLETEVKVVSMPEFISEGRAIQDFTRPDRIVLGATDPVAIEQIHDLMRPFNRLTDQVKVMAPRSAEYAKYAVNALLATRLSLVNELANNAERFDVDMEEVRQAVGSDSRIGFSYLYPGCGFGGASLSADIESLVETLHHCGSEVELLETVLEINESQKEVMFRKAWQYFGADLRGIKIAVWGLAFKPNTNTIINAPSQKTVEALVAQGAEVVVHDPKANKNFQNWWQAYAAQKETLEVDAVVFAEEMYAALEGVDALMILTEWKHFWNPDFQKMQQLMRRPVIFDGRNLFEPKRMAERGFDYFAVGRGMKLENH